jgi:hypothetical protein
LNISEKKADLAKRIEGASRQELPALIAEAGALLEISNKAITPSNISSSAYAAVRGFGGDLGSASNAAGHDINGRTPVSEHFDQHGRCITTLGRDLNPFQIDEKTLELMSKSVKTGHAFQVKLVDEDRVTRKGYNTVDSLLPAELMPGVVERIHEPRIADLLPTISSSSLNYEYISDNTTSNTVTGITAEGAAAPDAVLSFGETTLAAQAIKCTFGASYETLADRPSLLGYLTAEVFKQFSDEENSLLLNGSSGIVGLTQTSGITTVAVPDTADRR